MIYLCGYIACLVFLIRDSEEVDRLNGKEPKMEWNQMIGMILISFFWPVCLGFILAELNLVRKKPTP